MKSQTTLYKHMSAILFNSWPCSYCNALEDHHNHYLCHHQYVYFTCQIKTPVKGIGQQGQHHVLKSRTYCLCCSRTGKRERERLLLVVFSPSTYFITRKVMFLVGYPWNSLSSIPTTFEMHVEVSTAMLQPLSEQTKQIQS